MTPVDAGSIAAAVAIVAHDPSCTPASAALICSGTLVASNVVLTAAHCLDGNPPASLDVLAGGVALRVRTGRAHPEFDPTTHAHDLAVLVLDAPSATAPIPIRRTVEGLVIGDLLHVAGYGNDRIAQERGTVSLGAIEALQLRLLPSPSMTCRGDSGGPLLARVGDGFALIGVTTHGDPACKVDGFAARLDVHAAFIDQALTDAATPGKPLRAFDPNEDFCSAACARDADCPGGLLCVEGDDGRRCAFAGLPPARFTTSCTESCADDAPCVRVSATACRCADPCRPNEIVDSGTPNDAVPPAEDPGCGCTTASRAPCSTAQLPLMLLAALLLVRRRL